jgi:23S rRNA (cytosine1962-C5)-methyltransferase
MKPRASRSDPNQKAPKASMARAPLERTHERNAPAPQPVHGLGAQVNRRAADRLRSGHLWVYASDIESIELPENGADNPPALLPVADSRGLLLGTALYSPSSQIALRLVSREAIDEAAWLALLAERLRRAIVRRKSMLSDANDACRLCFSEADELPGLIADKYGKLVIFQFLAKGLDSAAVRETCVRVVREEIEPDAILERPDPRMRELEGLSAPNLEPLFVADGTASASTTDFHLNGLQVSLRCQCRTEDRGLPGPAGQLCRRAAVGAEAWRGGRHAAGRALDVCCYQGGFALHLAQVCGRSRGSTPPAPRWKWRSGILRPIATG